MAVIKSGAGSAPLTIDSVSNAARITLYDVNGLAVRPTPSGSYMAPIAVRFTGATAANSTIWALRNGGSLSMYIRRICLIASFDGTAAASTAIQELRRFNTATPTGGTAITVVAKDSTYGASTVADARQDVAGGALAVTSVVFENPLMSVGCARGVSGGVTPIVIDFTTSPESRPFIVLAPNEGLCIRNSIVAVVGDGITGFIEWDER